MSQIGWISVKKHIFLDILKFADPELLGTVCGGWGGRGGQGLKSTSLTFFKGIFGILKSGGKPTKKYPEETDLGSRNSMKDYTPEGFKQWSPA